MDPAEIGNLLNTISLILMTALLSAGTFLNYVRAKRKKEKSTALIYLGTGWLGWALSYILISIRLGISIGDGDFHILMYKIILTLDAFGFGCFFFFIGRFFNEKQTGLYSKKSFEILGVFLFIIQTLFVWLVGGFGVEDTPFGVEILPSFVCQNIMAMAMIVGGVLFYLAGKRFKRMGGKENQRNRESIGNVCMVLAFFMLLLIIHIFTTVWFGHGVLSGILLLIARGLLGSSSILTARLLK